MIPAFIRAYEAAAAINGYLIVAFAAPAASQTVGPAASATAPLVRASTDVRGATEAFVGFERPQGYQSIMLMHVSGTIWQQI